SPYVNALLQKLSLVMSQQQSSKQKLTLAREKFVQGLVLYNEKKYADAIPLLSESFSLNPNADETANYLKLAQQEDAREKAAKLTAQQPKTQKTAVATTTAATGTRARTATAARPQQPSGPASLTTVFNSTVTDGYILVKAGADVLAHE